MAASPGAQNEGKELVAIARLLLATDEPGFGNEAGANDEWGEGPVTTRAAPLWLQVSYKLLAAGFRGGTF